jgi:hypothetical protein
MKEQVCYVAPPSPHARGVRLIDRITAGDDFGVEAVTVMTPRGQPLTFDKERVLVPELLFEAGRGYQPLPELLASCAENCLSSGQCDADAARRLLRQIVLVGGAAEFPGIRPRTEFEIRALLRQGDGRFPRLCEALGSSVEVFVLNPPVGQHGRITTPRYAPFAGGCVRAACSAPLAETLSALTAEGPPDDDSPMRRASRNAILRRIFNIGGVGMFRAGGGGGFEDQILTQFRAAFHEEDEEDEDEEDVIDEDDVHEEDDSDDDSRE